MKPPNVCLTLIFPKVLEEDVVEHFLKRPDVVGGFTITHVEGYSADAGFASAKEQIHGRGPRVQVQLLVDRDDAADVVARLKAELGNRDVAYWITPIFEFGTLA